MFTQSELTLSTLLNPGGWVWEVVGLLGWCVGVSFASILVWRLLTKRNLKLGKFWTKYLAGLKRFKDKGRAHSLTLSWIFGLACMCVMVVAAATNQWPVVIDHNLRIESHPSSRQWWIVDDEHPQGFMYYACSWPGNEDWIKAGYFAKKATWQVEKDCNSIREAGLEFDYVWKSDGRAKTLKEMGYE